jgi:hypothetical protein
MQGDGFAPELPLALIIEIGHMATDWAVIEQNIILDCIHLTPAGKKLPRGFNLLLQHWAEVALQNRPEHRATIEDLADRLGRRADARNYALHGYWTQHGPDQFRAFWRDVRETPPSYQTLYSSMGELREQRHKLRDARCDVIEFLNQFRRGPQP